MVKEEGGRGKRTGRRTGGRKCIKTASAAVKKKDQHTKNIQKTEPLVPSKGFLSLNI